MNNTSTENNTSNKKYTIIIKDGYFITKNKSEGIFVNSETGNLELPSGTIQLLDEKGNNILNQCKYTFTDNYIRQERTLKELLLIKAKKINQKVTSFFKNLFKIK